MDQACALARRVLPQEAAGRTSAAAPHRPAGGAAPYAYLLDGPVSRRPGHPGARVTRGARPNARTRARGSPGSALETHRRGERLIVAAAMSKADCLPPPRSEAGQEPARRERPPRTTCHDISCCEA